MATGDIMPADPTLATTLTDGPLISKASSTRGAWQKFVSYVWDPDYYTKSDAERRLVQKLDCSLLLLLTFGFLMKYIDQTNLANAYVSGMKEDLKITGNQYTYMTVIYNVVTCVMSLPSNLVVLKVRPSWWLCACEIGWCAFTFAQAGAQTYQQMYAFRFFVAFFETAWVPVSYFLMGSWYTKSELAKRSGIFYVAGRYAFRFFVAFLETTRVPVSYFLMGSWYTQSELAKRSGIFYVAGRDENPSDLSLMTTPSIIPVADALALIRATLIDSAGSAFSGFMQAAIYTNLDGHAGLAGWRWLYIVCGCMTVPCGAAVFFFLPDFPHNTRSWFLSEEEKQMAIERCARNGTSAPAEYLNFKTLKVVVRSWHFWALVPIYVLYALGIQNYSQFNVYLKAAGYSVNARNNIPAYAWVTDIPFQFIWGWLSDRTGSRFAWCTIPLLFAIFPQSVLAAWPKSNGLKVFAFFVCGTSFITPIFFTWINEICHGSMEERGLIIAAANTAFYAFNAWLTSIIFLQTDSPRFKKGFSSTLAFTAASIFGMVIVWQLHLRQLRQEADEQAGRTHGGIEASAEGGVADEKEVVASAVVSELKH